MIDFNNIKISRIKDLSQLKKHPYLDLSNNQIK